MKARGAVAAVGLFGLLQGVSPARAYQQVVVGDEVYQALRSNPRARVVVALRQTSAPPTDVARLSSEIAAERRNVLEGLDDSDFVITHKWDTLSALAGDVTAVGLEKLSAEPDVQRIDLDIPGVMATAESVPLIHANELRSQGITGAGVVVAVLDTGVDTRHPDLAGDIVDQACFCANADGSGCCPGGGTQAMGSGAAEDAQGHGTNVTGIITGSGAVAPVGVAPDAKIVAIRVLDANGVASGTAQVLSGLDYVLKSRPEVKVVNLSLVFGAFPGTCDNVASYSMAFAQAIGALKARGTIVFASSGNDGLSNQIGLPACIGSAVAVGAVYDSNVGTISFGCTDSTTAADQVTCFSNSSSAVDLLAPGAAITSSGIGGGTVTFLGTSQAAPHAAGVAALLLQAKPGLTPDQIETALKASGVPDTDPKSGLTIPRIDAKAALDATP
jgi:subtilisin family serine protease